MLTKHDGEFYQSIFYQILCKKIRATSGLNVSNFKECENLAALMLQKGCTISTHTIARFFGVLPFRKTYPATLDIFANYIGFENLKAFIQQEKLFIERGLSAPNNLFELGQYSFVALEMAIESKDFKTIKEIIGSVDMNHPSIGKLTSFLGRMVRKSNCKKELLETLISVENGRRLFYESFVDEDDHEEYFSNALKAYYFQNVSTINNKLFGICYLISKQVYSKKKVDAQLLLDFEQLKANLQFEQLHFHEISRYIETSILIDGKSNKLKKSYPNYVNFLLNYEQKIDNHSFAWIIARPIKALAFNGILRKALDSKEFSSAILKCYKNSEVATIAELILQFVVHKYYFEQLEYHPPLKLQSKEFENENNARVILESSTSILYADSKIKNLMQDNVYSFAKLTGQTWVFELLE
jgi:hypothetical protein